MAAHSEHLQTTPATVQPGRAPVRGVVCHLIASNFAGGPEKQIVELSSRLGDLGWGAVVGSFREGRPTVEVIEVAAARGLQTFLIDTHSPFSPAAIGQLSRFLDQYDVDVLVTHGYKPNLIGYLATRRSEVIQVPMVRGYTAESRRIRTYEAIDRWVLKRLGRVLCVSGATRERLSTYGVDKRRIQVLHNAVACDAPIETLDLRSEFGLPGEARILVAAGRLSVEKGHRYLIEALQHLQHLDAPLYLVILGSGREEERLRRQAAGAGLDDRVILGGFRKPILPFLAGADLVVNPSLTEGLPNVVLEALSTRAPVVATDVGGVAELILPGKTGRLVPAGDAAALARAIEGALGDPSGTRTMAEEGYRLVSESFSFAAQASRFGRLCEDLKEPGHPSSPESGQPPRGEIEPGHPERREGKS